MRWGGCEGWGVCVVVWVVKGKFELEVDGGGYWGKMVRIWSGDFWGMLNVVGSDKGLWMVWKGRVGVGSGCEGRFVVGEEVGRICCVRVDDGGGVECIE